MEEKIFLKTLIPVRLFMHLTFVFSGFFFNLNRSSFGHTAPWLRWFQDFLRPTGWDQPLHNLTNLRFAFSRSCSPQGRNSPRHLEHGDHLLQQYDLSVLLIALHPKFLLHFFPPRESDATTEFQSIFDTVSDSLQ